jgi:hypothetical protein
MKGKKIRQELIAVIAINNLSLLCTAACSAPCSSAGAELHTSKLVHVPRLVLRKLRIDESFFYFNRKTML